MNLFPEDFAPFFVGYNKVFITQTKYHTCYYEALVRYATEAPKGMLLSIEPVSNVNPHKSQESGMNRYTWLNHPFVWGDNGVNLTIAIAEWIKVIEEF